MTSLNDLGCFDQAIWTALDDGVMLNTINYNKDINWLGFHFEPILYFFVPLYYLLPSVNWLILVQSFSLSVAAVPIFALARQVTKSEKQALLWCICYLFNPYLISAAVWDFHEVSVAVPFITLSLLAIENQHKRLFILCCLILLLCKEHMGLMVSSLGFVYAVKNRPNYIGMMIILLGVIMSALILGLIMPLLSPTQQHVMFSDGMDQLSRYSWLGHSPVEMIKTLVTSPGYVVNKMVYQYEFINYLKNLLLPFLFTSVLAPLFILPASADLLVNSLSDNPLMRGMISYHSVSIVPVLTVAAIYGCQKLPECWRFLSRKRIARYVCLSSLMLGYFAGPFPLPYMLNAWHPTRTVTFYDQRVDDIKELIDQASVTVQANVGPHFSQRNAIYRFPNKINQSQYIILHLYSPTKQLRGTFVGTLYHHLEMNPEDYLNTIEDLLVYKNFNIVYWNDPWLVLGKNSEPFNENVKMELKKKIESLRTEWL